MKYGLFRLLIGLFVIVFLIAIIPQQIFTEVVSADFDTLKKNAEKGDVNAQFNLGTMYYNGEGVSPDYKQAFYWFTKAAEQGAAEAQYYLGWMYYNGEGVSPDYKQAFYWSTKAAEQGYAKAQFYLGLMYLEGKGVPQDYKQAAYWFTKAAEQGDAKAQLNLGFMYDIGEGVTQNYKYAYVWSSLAASKGLEKAKHNRDLFAKEMTPQMLDEAQDLAAKIQYKIDHQAESSKAKSWNSKTNAAHEPEAKGFGSGFIISKDGYILTCYHVIKDSNLIKVKFGDDLNPAKLVYKDSNNDLALLKVSGTFPALAFSSDRTAKMGQEVFTIGYPNPVLQGINEKLTKGSINSLTGAQDDIRLYQISVPVQPGNSGGPLLDMNGNIIGIVVAMLDAKTAFQVSGSLPQNVNYAVKSTYAQALLDTLPEVSGSLLPAFKKETFDNVVDRVKKSVAMIVVYE